MDEIAVMYIQVWFIVMKWSITLLWFYSCTSTNLWLGKVGLLYTPLEWDSLHCSRNKACVDRWGAYNIIPMHAFISCSLCIHVNRIERIMQSCSSFIKNLTRCWICRFILSMMLAEEQLLRQSLPAWRWKCVLISNRDAYISIKYNSLFNWPYIVCEIHTRRSVRLDTTSDSSQYQQRFQMPPILRYGLVITMTQRRFSG